MAKEIYPKISYLNNGRNVELKKEFCNDRILNSVAEAFEGAGIYLPKELAKVISFENTVDRLSLPCDFRSVSFMQSPEFIVDSAL